MSAVPVYPVRVRGSLDPQLSRWLWLVKWLLAIPHYVVLLFLWIAFFFLTVAAFFAIVFTGRYPRSIFDFNLGVLRWSWRVAFYSYSALGTDRYPPFSLGEEPDYPATLEVPYPEHLSRGLVWVKSWLLAIPHYLVLAVFVGGGWIAWHSENWSWSWTAGGGLVGLLVCLAALTLLFAGRYPRGIFDLVLGLNRWCVRVGAYVSLMTDTYPPFRLDLGGDDGAAVAIPEAPAVRSGGGAGKIALLVVGGILGLISLGILAGGVTAVVYDQTQRDSAGYLSTSFKGYSTGTYALVSEKVQLDTPGLGSWHDVFGTARIESRADDPVFVGIARTADVAAYLGSVRHETARNLFERSGFHTVGTGAPATAPGDQSFWVASAEGRGTQQLTWDVRDGNWQVVVMNADGSRDVDTSLSIGAELPNLVWIGIAVLAIGGLVLGLAVLLVVLGARRRST